ncbi:FAD-dependent oxidoreductase [Streptomyces sp. ERV7]|uniref:FAD-dependent oxidoreductase n=1 Tax=Streptomyces sp. ERV7 TaxID=1322334 RepID=UPI000A772FAE|nr:FAD-dependent oxidoreductase [Streptomyces sp. ERV7]
MYALGSRAETTAVPGAAEYAHTIADFEQAVRLRHRVAEIASGGTLAVVGGGLTGVEAAAELAESHPGLRVRLFTGAEDVGAGLSPRARRHLRHALDRLGIGVHPNTAVTAVRPDGLATRDGASFAADAVVWTAGFRVPGPATTASSSSPAPTTARVPSC